MVTYGFDLLRQFREYHPSHGKHCHAVVRMYAKLYIHFKYNSFQLYKYTVWFLKLYAILTNVCAVM